MIYDDNEMWDDIEETIEQKQINEEVKKQKLIQEKLQETLKNNFFKKHNWLQIFENFKKIEMNIFDLKRLQDLVYEYKLTEFKQLFTTKFLKNHNYTTFRYDDFYQVDIYHCFVNQSTKRLFRVLVGVFVYKYIDYWHEKALYYEICSLGFLDFYKLLNNFLSNNFFKEFTNKMVKNHLSIMTFDEKEVYLKYLYDNFDIFVKNLRY